ncbi:MAG: YitT family protein [Lachnospiraceae bacterium]|nr:YitT family protein [Lachnospiraceae bacterium]
MTRQKILKTVLNILMITAGNFLLAVSVCAFIVPYDITVGGATGIGVICAKALGIPMWITVLVINMICLPLARIFVGRKLVEGSLLSSVLYPLALSLAERIPHIAEISSSLILSAIYAGVIGGAGVGIVMKAEGSTGGLDIPPLILQKKLKIPVKTSMYAMDAAIMLGQLPFCQADRVLYGIASAWIFTQMIDKVLLLGQKMYEVTVVTDRYEELRRELLENDYGVTMAVAETGLLRKPTRQVISTISSASLRHIRKLISRVDENAFVRIAQVTTVLGRGFDRERVDLDLQIDGRQQSE